MVHPKRFNKSYKLLFTRSKSHQLLLEPHWNRPLDLCTFTQFCSSKMATFEKLNSRRQKKMLAARRIWAPNPENGKPMIHYFSYHQDTSVQVIIRCQRLVRPQKNINRSVWRWNTLKINGACEAQSWKKAFLGVKWNLLSGMFAVARMPSNIQSRKLAWRSF